MLAGDLQIFQDTFLDCQTGNHDDELPEAVLFVQFVDGAKIDIGLARAGFHLEGKMQAVQLAAYRDAVGLLYGLQILQDCRFVNRKVIANHKFGAVEVLVLREGPFQAEIAGTDGLAAEQVGYGLYRFKLIILVGIELYLHWRYCLF